MNNVDEWESQKLKKELGSDSEKSEQLCYTDADIGEEVETIIEGIRYTDIIIEMWLPDGQRIIGPRLKCGHIFARYTMLPAMEAASEATKKMFEDVGE